MTDYLKNYINEQVGYIDDDVYFKAIDDLSKELITKQVYDDLKLYSATRRSDLLSIETINRVKKRVDIFKFYKQQVDGGDNPWAAA